MLSHETYMQRALQLARHGELHASPNPMVGAVIVAPDGSIVGEGWHRCCGEAHAEVNAVNSVAPGIDFRECTIYVTLEPCSHYGKTPPCAKLLCEKQFAKVVVATLDPFEKVSGRGIEMLRNADIEVIVGVLEQQARALNSKFFTAHTLRRPYVTLKWAESADGFIDARKDARESAAAISTPSTLPRVHKLRATHDAILVGSGTYLADHPTLTVRHYAGHSPRRYVADRRGRITAPQEGWTRLTMSTPAEMLTYMYNDGVTSVLVEGGRTLLQAFIDASLYDAVAVECNPRLLLAAEPYTTPAPQLSGIQRFINLE